MPLFSSRNSYLDFLRIFAILAVIVIHSIATIVLQSPVGSKRWLVGNIIDSFMRWAVPVFVMISGALLIKKKTFTNRDTFLKRKLIRIFIPLIIWPLIYVGWNYLFFNATPDRLSILNGYISGSPAPGHLYFLFLIAGLYLIAPVISLYADSVNKRQFLIATIIILALTGTWHIVTTLIPGQENGQQLNALTQGLPYIGYFMLGYALKDVRIKRSWIPFVTFFLSGATISIVSYYMTLSYGLGKGLTFYAFPSFLAMSLAVSAYFMGNTLYEKATAPLSKQTTKKVEGLLEVLSGATFGVYLIHLMIMATAIKLLNLDLTSLSQTLLVFTLTAVFSYAASLMLIRIPYVRVLVR